MQYDALSFDEFTIIPEKWWSLLLELKTRKPTIRMRFYGDPQQLHSNDYGVPISVFSPLVRLLQLGIDALPGRW